MMRVRVGHKGKLKMTFDLIDKVGEDTMKGSKKFNYLAPLEGLKEPFYW